MFSLLSCGKKVMLIVLLITPHELFELFPVGSENQGLFGFSAFA